MDRLPPELHHMICALLEHGDVRKLRLVNSHLAELGFHYLFPDGHVGFYFCSRDLAMLRDIASHPQLNHAVNTLHLEAHTLNPEKLDFADWKQTTAAFHHPRFPNWQRPAVGPSTKEDSRRHYNSCLGMLVDQRRAVQSMTDTDWRRHYNIYLGMLEDQHRLLTSEHEIAALSTVFKKCPNLQSIVLSNGYLHSARQIHQPFAGALQRPDDHLLPPGRQLLDILLGAAGLAQAPLTSLAAGLISWHFLTVFSGGERGASGEVMRALAPLKMLELRLTTTLASDDFGGFEVPQCREHLDKHDSLRRMLCGIPDLQSLKLSFDFRNESRAHPSLPTHAAGLAGIVLRSPTWPALHTLELGCFDSKADILMAVFTRQKATLKRVVLVDVWLTADGTRDAGDDDDDDDDDTPGSWLTLLPLLRDTLALDYGCLHGELIARAKPVEEWHLPYADFTDEKDVRLMQDIANYLTRKTDLCPLSRKNMSFRRSTRSWFSTEMLRSVASDSESSN